MFDGSAQSFALALLIPLIMAEAVISRLLRRPAYDAASTETNLGVVFGWLLFGPITGIVLAFCIALGNRFAVIDPGHGVAAYILLFLSADLLYYVWHRANHMSRWLWATHSVHHSAPRLNFLASMRQGWTDVFAGTWLFFAPLGLLGFPLSMCLSYFLVLQAVQLLSHNEWMGKLGRLEWIFVTPSNHRVHHSLEAQHVDKNFGGLLIVWDRLFGTYAPEGARIHRFGYADGPPDKAGVLTVVFWGWFPIWRDLREAIANHLRQRARPPRG